MTIKTIFLDRDGVINKEVNYLHNIDDFEFITGVFEACRHFESLNYELIIVTNQSGIARQLYTENDYQVITKWMINQFKKNDVNILDVNSILYNNKPEPIPTLDDFVIKKKIITAPNYPRQKNIMNKNFRYKGVKKYEK